ncbi:MAG: D-alanyl-D-alanine carboxypeptidase (penicillin-binding protein 5/6) [Pelagibacterales bacterium]|nr:D-alanyl-D-alanine carboxypeptidase (penicillin-binding protein 5/6) [Pelagibacterales bacterium]
MKLFKIILVVFFALNLKAHSNIEINARYAILQDHLSGEILYEKEADSVIYPASMTKIMTTIVAFDLLKKGETSLDEKITISEKAWRMSQSGYSSMFIMLNDQVTVENLLKGIIIVSGNDACVALAEGLAGSEEDFVIMMNEKVNEIGLENTNFNNSSGINDPDNYSTVRDILKMSEYLIKNYPEYYSYYKEKEFTWDRTGGDPIKQGNRNPLLYKNIGADGIKTGFLTVEKYSLASSMLVGKRRINAVASGFDTKNDRSKDSAKLLSWGLRTFDTIQVTKKNEPFIKLKVWLGKNENVNAVTYESVYLTIPKRKKNTIKAVIEYNNNLSAPIKKGDKIGVLNVFIKDELKKEIDVFSNENIKKANIFSRLLKSFNFLVWGDV